VDEAAKPARLIEVVLDEASIGRNTPEVEHERQVAIFDLLEQNSFALVDGPAGPYKLTLAIAEQRLAFAVTAGDDSAPCVTHLLSLTPFRSIVKDYFMVCESYFDAIRTAPPNKIEAMDMGRRAVHNEGSQLLMERLEGKIAIDFDTARRLFTLLCALQWKG
jgi:uncharacterized protein (UPF0262 family)